MNAYQIKWIAIITMFIDHVGLFFFPQVIWFRILGRLSFPLFAWLIANGAYYTRDITKYLVRLYFFALLSQLPFLLANKELNPLFSDLNVLCTLFLGLAVITIIQRTKEWKVWILFTAIGATIAQFLQTDYGGFGVVVIVGFYLFFSNFWYLVIAQIVIFFVPFFIFPLSFSRIVEPIGLLSLIVIRFYNNKSGPSAKYLFYIIYPLQYIVFYFLLTKLLAFSGLRPL